MSNFVKAQGIWYKNEIKTIKKRADVPMQPLFEAFMNAWESIIDRFSREHFNKGLIHFSYERYLINQLRKEFGLQGTPIRMIVREKNEKDV